MLIIQLGQRLRELRKFHNFTQEYVSSKLHVERPAYSNYECGKRALPLELLVQLADFYQVSIDDLLCNPDFSPSAATDEFAVTSISNEEKILLRFYRLLSNNEKREALQFVQFKIQNQKQSR